MKQTSLTILCGVVLGCLLPAAASGAWLSQFWAYRRPIDLGKVKPTRLEGSDIAVVTFSTCGQAKPDGSDIVIATPNGKTVPSRVLQTGSGDLVCVAFAVTDGRSRYYAYFGSSKTLSDKQPLDIRRGVLLETWELPRGNGVVSLEDAKEIFDKKVKKLYGRTFLDNIFIGVNPFGPENNVASIFTGYLLCPRDGEYVFAPSSRNASFLLIDGKLVVDNGWSRAPQRRARIRETVTLTKGMHALTFYHVSSGGDPVAAVAWKPPGEKKMVPIPPEAFAPVFRATAGPLEQYGRPITLDIRAVHADEAFVADRYYQRYRFEAVTSGKPVRAVRWTWDFGDGQTAVGDNVEHVYLRPGLYDVKVSGQADRYKLERTMQIAVERPWDRVQQRMKNRLGEYAKIVADYKFAVLDGASNAEAMILLDRAGDADGVQRAGEALMKRDKMPSGYMATVVPLYVERLLANGRAAQAADVLERAATMTDNDAATVRLLTRAGEIRLDELDNDKAAMVLFEGVIEKYKRPLTAAAVRDARIGVGDVWRFRGDYKKAAAAYAAAGRVSDDNVKAEIRRGDLARHVEAYLREGDYADARDYLMQWKRTFPADALEGFWSLLAVRLDMAEKHYAAAAREAEILVKVNPRSNYAPEVLMLAAEAYTELDQPEKAAGALKRIVDNYPESPLAVKAAEKLKKR